MNKEDNTMEGELTKNVYEQYFVVVTFYMTNKIGTIFYCKCLDYTYRGDFVEKLIYSQGFIHICFNNLEKNLTQNNHYQRN